MKSVSLGPLEQEVMKCIWRGNTCTVRGVVDCLNQNREIAYNTIQTVMTRLVDKGLLKRTLQGRVYIYQPKQRKKNILRLAIIQSMSSFVNQFGEEALVAFVDGIEDISEETRQKLIRKLQKK